MRGEVRDSVYASKETPMEMESLQELLVEEMRDLYSAENQLTKALPKMVKKASNPQLKKAFETHLRETGGPGQRLQKIFEKLGKKPTARSVRPWRA
jgi:ferritin-like metal-binding protein YciE